MTRELDVQLGGRHQLDEKAKVRKITIKVETLRLTLHALEDVYNRAISYSDALVKDAMTALLEETRGRL